uniref:Reverse transcriptase zinc-binding domain-containing protein n=1 Tax=Cannabis sativa TaxID=3483 RepID=A0A803NL76_CANSA
MEMGKIRDCANCSYECVIVSTIGKSIMADKVTRDRPMVKYARVLVEMDITDEPPQTIHFLNEHGQLIEQGVDYEWLPVKCKFYNGYGHIMADCRKNNNVVSRKQTMEKKQSNLKPNDGRKANGRGSSKAIVTKEEVIARKEGHSDEAQLYEIEERGDSSNGEFYHELVSNTTKTELVKETDPLKGKTIVTGKGLLRGEGDGEWYIPKKTIQTRRKNQSMPLVVADVKMACRANEFCATFVYGSNLVQERNRLWQYVLVVGMRGKFKAALLYNSLLQPEHESYSRAVWNRLSLPKNMFILWQTVHVHLLTRDFLCRFGIDNVENIYHVCGMGIERHSHLFYECHFSVQVVAFTLQWLVEHYN